MDEETRAGFDDMRRGFAEISARFDGVDRRFDRVDQRFADVDGRLVEANRGTTEVSQRVDTLEERVMREIRQLGVISEDLRSQIQLVAEGVVGNGRAIERLRVEMNERFRENEVIVGGAFRQIRRDLDELRDDRS
jgi:hypothetical protein